MKSNVKYCSTGCPEKLFAHDYMVEEACLQLRRADALQSNPSLAVKPFDERMPEYRANIRAGPLYDEGNAETGTQLIGKGRCTPLLLPTNQEISSYGLPATRKPGPGKLYF